MPYYFLNNIVGLSDNMPDLWNKEDEKNFFLETLNNVSRDSLFYSTDDGRLVAYWEKIYTGQRYTLQSRNSHIGTFTEKWFSQLIQEYARSKGLFSLHKVRCNELSLTKSSPGDVVICKKNSINQNPGDIVAIFEVKMSIVWNWENINGNLIELGDYTTHRGNPSLLRSDTMLKAIGKCVNIRLSCPEASKIPIIVIGNTPITRSYLSKVDYLRKCGIIQGFWSVNPNPNNSSNTLKYTREKGFYRMETYNELLSHLDGILNQDLSFFSSMKSKEEIGRILSIAYQETELEHKAQKFLELLRE